MSSTTRSHPEDADALVTSAGVDDDDLAGLPEDRDHSAVAVTAPDDGDDEREYIAPLGRSTPRPPSDRLERPAPSPSRRRRRNRPAWRARLLVVATAVGLVLAVIAVISMATDSGESTGGQAVDAPGARPASDAAVGAFAAQFARAFLTYSPQHPDYHTLAIRPFLASELQARDPLDVPRRGANQTVTTVAVAGVKARGATRSLVTVAATVINRTVTTRYLAIPVARDAAGGVVVDDYPAFVAGPPRARVEVSRAPALVGGEADAIRRVLRAFFTDYLSGSKPAGLAAGARVAPLEQRYDLQKLRVGQLTGGDSVNRTVLVSVRARDRETNASYALRYRATIVHRDRWQVQSLQDSSAR